MTLKRQFKKGSASNIPGYIVCFFTRDFGKRLKCEINIRENRRGNQEWTIQGHW